MKRLVLLAAVLTFAGCKKEPPKATAGSAAMTGRSGAATGSAAMPKTASEDELAADYMACWSDWNASKWDAFQACYTADTVMEMPGSQMPVRSGPNAIVEHAKALHAEFPDIKGQPMLVLVSGHQLASVALITGTNTMPVKRPDGDRPATNKPIGILAAQIVTFEPSGKVMHEASYADNMTIAGQLKPDKDHPTRPVIDKLAMPEETLIAKDDTRERTNLAAIQQFDDAFDHHDAKALAGVLADNLKWSEQPQPADLDRKAMLAHTDQLWKAFSDLKLGDRKSFAAGDYVVTTASLDGTNDGDLPAMHVKKSGKKVSLPFAAIYKLTNGKVSAAWVFYERADLATQLASTKK